MLKRLFSRRQTERSAQNQKPMFENVEQRVLMHSPAFTSIIADNKGEVFATVQPSSAAEIDTTTINSASIQMYTAGTDGTLGTTDDVRVHAALNYNATNGRLTIRGAIPANVGYRVRINGNRLKSQDGFATDAEFNGATVLSGNGVAGGIGDFRVKRDTSTTPTVRMYTSAGAIAIRLRGDLEPITVNNFLRYVNANRYEGTAFHRSGRTEASPINIVQGGGYLDADLASETQIQHFDPIVLETNPALLNVRGTIAMARTFVANSATSEFFFNTQTNTFLDPSGPGTGYATFGTIVSGLNVPDTIFAAPTVAKSTNLTNVPQVNGADVTLRRVAVAARVVALT